MRNFRGWRPEHVAVVPVLTLVVSAAFTALLLATGIAAHEQFRVWLFAPGFALMTLAACARRRFPALAYLVTVGVTAGLVAAVGDLGFTPLYWAAIVSLAIRVSGPPLAALAGAGIVVDGIVSSLTAASWVVPTVNILISYAVLLLLGKVIAHNRSQSEISTTALADAQVRLERAIENERRTMARELHDVAAHHLTAMIIQARSADKLLTTDLEASRELLQEVVTSGQRTLDGLRQIVGILRFSSDEHATPQPTIADIADLIEHSRHSFGSVRVDIVDDVERIDSAVQLACFRIVREALSNAMRHAPGSDIDVRLGRRNGSILVTVDDKGSGGPSAGGGQGFGIAGMRERAVLLGGRLTAGPTPGGGWNVTAQLPVDGRVIA